MIFEIENKQGAKLKLSTLGARIMALHIPNQHGDFIDVVQGFDTEQEYAEKSKSQGAICGRYANRISNARYTYEGQTVILPANDGEHCLHGGNHELRLAEFEAEQFGKQVHFEYHSPHLERGFPGNLKIEVTYTLTDENLVRIHLQASTDQPTPVNLTSHPYFNLNGAGNGEILDHQLKINSQEVVEIDGEGIPTGNILPIAETPFDFIELTPIKDNITDNHAQLDLIGGFDHCFVMNEYAANTLKEDATLASLETDIHLTVRSTYPGLQVYTANGEQHHGKNGMFYDKRSAICLEPQYFPDSPNQPDFPFSFLLPDESYDHTIEYDFKKPE